MNRKQRRAAQMQSRSTVGSGNAMRQLLAQAAQFERQRRLDEAARTYKKLLALKPDHAEALNNLGCVLRAQGKLAEASANFARALALTPQLYDRFTAIVATLASLLPPLAEAMRRANAAWPQRLTAGQLFTAEARVEIESDPLLLDLLRATPIRDLALERVLTALRAALLAEALAGQTVATARLAFAAALAQQCFINEYVFSISAEEDKQFAQLSGCAQTPLQIAAFAMYAPLSALPQALSLLARDASPLAELIAQQLREPQEERALREAMPRLTTIDDDVSQRVRAQYEENPFPRWVHAPNGIEATSIDLHLRQLFPTAAFKPHNKMQGLDVLVAGCGTGFHAIGTAMSFAGARVLAIDLSLVSLAYAKRQTPAALRTAIDYAQADILKLGTINRSFDLVDATGVLHHMAQPLEAARILLDLVRPGGFMHLGFYSELGRARIVSARAYIAERGYGGTPSDIRRFRQDVLASPHARISELNDYFTMSECRDLLFHVHEKRLTIPEIRSFITAHGLTFIGFEFEPAAQQQYRAEFAHAGWSTSDIDRWQEIESQHPETFSNMYRLWVQKPLT